MSAPYPDHAPRDWYRNEFISRVKDAGYTFDGVFIRGDGLDKPMRLATFEGRYKYRAIFALLEQATKVLP